MSGVDNNCLLLIQARLGSTRLPSKVLLPLGNFTSLSLMFQRLTKNFNARNIVFLIPAGEKDEALKKYLISKNLNYFEGEEDDVFKRYRAALKELAQNKKTFIRLTGDCPLIDPDYIFQGLQMFKDKGLDYLKTSKKMPEGLDFEIVSVPAFMNIQEDDVTPLERMHATYYFNQHSNEFKTNEFDTGVDYSDYRVTLDEKLDYEVLVEIAKNFGDALKTASWDDIKTFLDQHETVKRHNNKIERNQGLRTDLEKLDKKTT